MLLPIDNCEVIRSFRNLIVFFLFSCLSVLIASGCKPMHAQIKTSSAFDGIAFKSHRVASKTVKLSNGEYREKTAPEATSEIVVRLDDHLAKGKIDGAEVAAAVLVTEMGSGEIYYDLALLKKKTAGWENTDMVDLGDRVKIKAVSIENDEIIVSFLDHGPYDRPCCATLEKDYTYGLSGDRMVKIETESPPELIGTLWKWNETYYKDDTYVQPYDPGLYTLQMKADGSITSRVDCNKAEGGYTMEGEYLTLKIAPSTMAVCQAESLSDQYLADLNKCLRYYIKNRDLYIVLKNESGVMKFTL